MNNLMNRAYDRPANWISNLLCFNYGHCRAPLTGGDERPQTRLAQVTSAALAPSASLDIYPNPATSWVTFHYNLQAEPEQAELTVRDAAGRIVYHVALHAKEQQQLWDTREVSSGTYSVVVFNAGRELRTAKLIVKQ